MHDRLGPLLRARLAARGRSLRAVAREAGVSHATLSRVLNGRTHPTRRVLEALAPVLGLAVGELVAAAGMGPPEQDSVWAVLRDMGIDPSPGEILGRVREGLVRLREYAATEEAFSLAREGLDRKVTALGARGPVIAKLRGLGRLYLDGGDAPWEARLAAGSAVLYFLHALDVIDDFIWPVGYIDDAVAVALAEAEVRQLLAVDRSTRRDSPCVRTM